MGYIMRWLLRGKRSRLLMAALLLLAFAPNAFFLQHYGLFEVHATKAPVAADEHAQHRAPNSAPVEAAPQPRVHCHVGPENCSASSGLSNAIVIAAALVLMLLGGGVLALDSRPQKVTLLDLSRRLIVPPRLNLRPV